MYRKANSMNLTLTGVIRVALLLSHSLIFRCTGRKAIICADLLLEADCRFQEVTIRFGLIGCISLAWIQHCTNELEAEMVSVGWWMNWESKTKLKSRLLERTLLYCVHLILTRWQCSHFSWLKTDRKKETLCLTITKHYTRS